MNVSSVARWVVLAVVVAVLCIGGLGPASASGALAMPHSNACLDRGRRTYTEQGYTIVIPAGYVSRGDRGACVYYLQELLRAQGATIDVDGIFGGQTDRIVRRVQRPGERDGIVGPHTWYDLMFLT